MKVLIVAPYPRTRDAHGEESLGGVASYAKNLVNELRAHARVRVLSPTDGEPGARLDGDVEIEDVPRSGTHVARALRRLVSDVDVVHVQFEQHLYGGPLGLLRLARALRAARATHRVVVTLHQVPDLAAIDRRFLHENAFPPIPFLARAWLRIQIALLAFCSHALLVHEQAFADRLIRQHRVRAAKIRVVPHGIEPPRATLDRADARRALGVNGQVTILYFGYVTGYKGVDLLVEALERLEPSERSRAHVIIAGKAPGRKLEDRRFRAAHDALEARIAALAPWVRREGFLTQAQIDERLVAADLVVFPYRQVFGASGPMSMAQGQAAPILASDAFRGMGLADESLFPLSPDGLAAKLREAIRDEALRARLKDAAIAQRGRASWRDVAQATLACYQPAPPAILLMGAYGQDNLGDEAILEVHLQQLARFPTTVVSSNPAQSAARYHVPAVQTYGGDRRCALAAFRASDALVYGGGSLLKELPAPMFRYRLVGNLMAASLAARAAGKRAAFSAMGVERLPTRLGRALARAAADASHLMLVRDEGSRDALRAVGATRDVRVVADPVYLLKEDDAAIAWARSYAAQFDRPIVVLNPIRSREVGATDDEVVAAFGALAEHIMATSEAHVVLLPFKTAGDDSDVALCREVLDRIGPTSRVSMAPLDLRPAMVLALLRRASFFVGMRHHGVLLALVARTPLVAVPYAEKTSNLVREFGLTRHSLRAEDLTPAALVAAFGRAWAEREGIVTSTAAPLARMEARAQDNFDALRAFLVSGSVG